MSIWLIISPLILWLTLGALGVWLLRTPAPRLWTTMQLAVAKKPFEPARWNHRLFAWEMKAFGAFMLIIPIFATIMALLVAVGVVQPAQN